MRGNTSPAWGRSGSVLIQACCSSPFYSHVPGFRCVYVALSAVVSAGERGLAGMHE